MTHYHADHVQGLFHLRWGSGDSISVYGSKDAQGCVELHRNSGVLDFQPWLKPFKPIKPIKLDSLTVIPVPLKHSKPTLGYCLNDGGIKLAYLTDTFVLPVETEHFLHSWEPDVVVLDA
ncbi:MBL fold metallo-hydrolase [Vreelandella populi]|uniref:MBL fold metallo-hydrolase n=1 Tax=Vreelandella populi TaxID=2498858 RepID=UPI0021AF471A|nr:MBL fold metallo-hydrolase [Halomonas populi]